MPTLSPLLAEALEAQRAGDGGRAEALYRRALDADPREPTALYLYALLHFEAGRVDRAQVLFEQVVALRPEHAEAQVTLAHLFHWRGEHAAAAAGYRRACALAPERADAAVGLANALREGGDAAGAVEAALSAVARFRDDPSARTALGAAKRAQGDLAAAIDAYRAAVALAPDVAGAHAALALLLLEAGRAEEALGHADAAASLDDGVVEGWFALGAALLALSRADAAVLALERAVEIAPGRASIHLDLANAYAACGRAADAEAHLMIAIALDSELAEAHASLGSVYLRAGRVADAERCSTQALALNPEIAAAHLNLASLLAERGRAAEAKAHRDRAFAGRNLIFEPAAGSPLVVLMPTTAEAGNVPLRDLMPADRFSRLRWIVEYADEAQIAALPPFDVVFNAIGDPDLAGPGAAPLSRFLASCSTAVLNRPERVARTRRDRLPILLAGLDGVIVPPTARLDAADIASDGLARATAAAGLAAPVLVRPIGSHGGKGLRLARTQKALARFRPEGDVYVTAFVDYRSTDGFYRKYRVVFVDRAPMPYHLAISPRWLVHHGSAEMDGDADRRAEEARFLADPVAAVGANAWAAVAAIGAAVDLDYAGVDFGLTANGAVLVFEANATMLVHAEPADGVYAYKNRAVGEIARAFAEMLTGAAARGGRRPIRRT